MVEKTLQKFYDDLNTILGLKFFDLLIWGSVVLNDFIPHQGDIDFIVLLNSDLNENEIKEIEKLHDAYRNDRLNLSYQLEGCYYPKQILQKLEASIIGLYIGTRRKGWKVIKNFKNSMLDLVQWKNNGKMYCGKNVEFYIPSSIEIFEEIRKDYSVWNSIIDDSELPSYVIVHWVARTLFFLKHNKIGSKTESCRCFYDNYYKNEYVYECIFIRSPGIGDELRHKTHYKEVAKVCLEKVYYEFSELGLTNL